MSKLRELLGKLPELVRPWASVYVDMLEREAPDRVEIFIREALSRGWTAAQWAMMARMTTKEIIDEQKAANALLATMNNKTAAFKKAQEEAIVDILLKVLASALA